MIFMGSTALTDGFRLIGFETWAAPTPKDVDRILRELINKRQNAFLVIDQVLAEADIPMLDRVRAEGGHIVVSAVPPLNQPQQFRTRIDDRLQTMLGGEGLL